MAVEVAVNGEAALETVDQGNKGVVFLYWV
jgi:hypothetical protein